MNIKSAIFYQGESDCNAAAAPKYNCTFASMIRDWRQVWHSNTNGSTPIDFPFGFVQLSTWGAADGKPNKQDELVATVRYGQTANYGKCM
jgi:sialate O-acetylesterase